MFRSFFSRPSSGGPPLCFVPLLFLPLICVRWVCIITQYVAACVCHPCVFGVLVCWWSACDTSRSPTDKNTKHMFVWLPYKSIPNTKLLIWAYTLVTNWLFPWLRFYTLRFFRAFSSVVRQMPGYTSQSWGTVRTLPN